MISLSLDNLQSIQCQLINNNNKEQAFPLVLFFKMDPMWTNFILIIFYMRKVVSCLIISTYIDNTIMIYLIPETSLFALFVAYNNNYKICESIIMHLYTFKWFTF